MHLGSDTTAPPELAAFSLEVEAVLARHYPLRPVASDATFVWGEGPDAFPGLLEPDDDEVRAELAATREWRRRLYDARLAWITGPSRYGGRDLPGAYQKAFDAVARRYAVPGNGLLRVGLGMVAPTVLAHGGDRLRDAYLVALQRADVIGCQLFSEPGAGSDLAGVATRAKPAGDAWRVSGQKVWASGAHLSDIGLLLCRTGEGPRHRNLTMFLLDMRAPGVAVRPLVQMNGAAFFNEVFLEDVKIPDDHRLGEVGDGWKVAMTTLMNERQAIGGGGLGGSGVLSSERLVAMVRHFDRAADPCVRQELARLVIELRLARYTRLRVEARRQAGEAPGPEMSLAKLGLARNMAALSEFVGWILGPRLTADTGEWGTFRWTDVVLTAPGMRIGGGTDEVMKNVIAERVLGLPRDPG
jgi:alkylation response protein AidB-like acyl-CoA dehydrogenase